MGEVGRLDFGLVRAFRRANQQLERERLRRTARAARAGVDAETLERTAAESELARRTDRLICELIRTNLPLIKLITRQRRRATLGADNLPWDDALSLGCTAFEKAMHTFDPSRASLSTYLRGKIINELQQAARMNWATMVMPRGVRAPAPERFEGPDEFDRLTEGSDDVDDIRLAAVEFDQPPPAPLPARRTALDVFLEDNCRFAPSAREAMSAVVGRFETIARERGEYAPQGAVTRALEERGVGLTRVRVPWDRNPVRGFRGMCLQNAPRGAFPPSAQVL